MIKKKLGIKNINQTPREINIFYKNLIQIIPRSNYPYNDPKTLISYTRKSKLLNGLGNVRKCIIVFSFDWIDRFQKVLGKPHQNFFEFDIYKINKKKFLLMNVTLGGQSACHHMEKLKALGIRRFIALGHCGTLQEKVAIGDIFIPLRALRGEHISNLYIPPGPFSLPSKFLFERLQKSSEKKIKKNNLVRGYWTGDTYTVESMFREPRKRVELCSEKGVLGIEAESSAIFAFGMYHKVEVASIFVVSNKIKKNDWDPAFFSHRVAVAEEKLIEIAADAI